MLSPHPSSIPIAMTTQPRPQGHSATRNVTAPPRPPPPRPSLQIGEEGTLTPHPQAWSLAPGSQAVPETPARAEGRGPAQEARAGVWAEEEQPPPGHLGPVAS